MTINRCALILVLATMSLLGACGVQREDAAAHKEDALRVAEIYVEQKYPDLNRAILKPRLADHGKYWLVAYDLPAGMAGGAPKLVIEKGTGKVVVAFEDQ